MDKYSEDPETISLYPGELYEEDLTPDCGVEIDEKCNEIYEGKKINSIVSQLTISNTCGTNTSDDRMWTN